MTQNPIETRIQLEPEDIAFRNQILREKKFGIITVIVILALVSGFPVWFLQAQEKVPASTLWGVIAILTVIMLAAVACYVVFTRQIQRDLEIDENVLMPAVVVEGWQTNERRDEFLRVNIGNNMVTLFMNVMKRHVDDVRDLDRLMPGTELLVEMTPNARVIIRIMRL